MGLDQYWNVVETVTYRTHRKIPTLQDFMGNIYREQGGTEVFNCVALTITHDILDRLEAAIGNSSLDENASGFFWGMHDEGDYKEIKEAIKEARELLEEGKVVTYDSWW